LFMQTVRIDVTGGKKAGREGAGSFFGSKEPVSKTAGGRQKSWGRALGWQKRKGGNTRKGKGGGVLRGGTNLENQRKTPNKKREEESVRG